MGVIMVPVICITNIVLLHISTSLHLFYLSEAAMKDLQLIPQDFPAEPTKAAGTQQPQKALWGFPLYKGPPAHPDTIPSTQTQENPAKLEAWIHNHYDAGAFNVCPHQPLHTMSVKPLNITFKPDAVPSAVHCLIPVPHLWKKAVKADVN